MNRICFVLLSIFSLPCLAVDNYDTPEFHAYMAEMYVSNDPRMIQARSDVIRLSDGSGIEAADHAPWMWRWDYLYGVMLETHNPSKSRLKFKEAIDTADKYMSASPVGNYTHGPQWYALCYVRLSQYTDPATSKRWLAAQDARIKDAMGWGAWGPKTRLVDSDLTFGAFSLITTTDELLGTAYSSLQSANAVDGTAWVACSVSDMWTEISKWLEHDGEFIEGTLYNRGTEREIAFTSGLVSPKYPKLREFVMANGVQCQWRFTPGFKPDGYVFWGDHQGERDLHTYIQGPHFHLLAALGADPTGNLLSIAQTIYPVRDAIAGDHSILTLDPRKLPLRPEVKFPTGIRQSSVGLTIFQSPQEVVSVFCPVPVSGTVDEFIDHQMVQWDIRIWKNGAWRLERPSAYVPWSRNHNGSECYGFDPPYDKRCHDAVLVDGGFEVVMEAKDLTNPPGYEPAPPFISNWTRKVRYSHGRTIVSETIDAVDPKTLPRFERRLYGTWYYDRKVAPLAQFFHAPVEPTPIDKGFEWIDVAGTKQKLLTTAPIRTIAKVEPGINVSLLTPPSQAQGWVMQLGADRTIDTVLGEASDSGLILPGDEPMPSGIPVKGVIQGKKLIIELP